jgi:hypothetical protein
MDQFKLKRPAAYVELLLSFEARKRSASPHRDSSFNIFPPFAFIDYYRKSKGKEVWEVSYVMRNTSLNESMLNDVDCTRNILQPSE